MEKIEEDLETDIAHSMRRGGGARSSGIILNA